jgi:hypothetical protein
MPAAASRPGGPVERPREHGHRCVLVKGGHLRADAVAERVIGSLRREGRDRIIPLDERHLRAILDRYGDSYNHHRPHRTPQLRPPRPQERPQAGPVTLGPGTSVQSWPILGGLHHVYEYAAGRDRSLAVR